MSTETLEQQLEARDPDVRLMLQVRDDVSGAFEVLVNRYQHRLLGVMVHLVGRVEEAEDLTQEVFLRIYRARKGYRPRAKFSTWLFTIANNLALNHLRGKGRNPTVALSSGEATTSSVSSVRPAEEPRPGPRGDALGPDAQGRALGRGPRGARRPGRGPEGRRPAEQVRGHELRRDRRGDGTVGGGRQVAAGPGAEPPPRAARTVFEDRSTRP